MKTTIEIYKDRKREWRWRALRKGRIVADSGEGYEKRVSCLRSFLRFKTAPHSFVFK